MKNKLNPSQQKKEEEVIKIKTEINEKIHEKVLTNQKRDGNIRSSKENKRKRKKQLHKERSFVIPMGT